MGLRALRANDSAYDLKQVEILGEETTAPSGTDMELERMRQLIHDLRNPVGSVSMAVEMLLGPLHGGLEAMPEDVARRVEGTLVALSESAQQLRYLVSDLGGLATGDAPPTPTAPSRQPPPQ